MSTIAAAEPAGPLGSGLRELAGCGGCAAKADPELVAMLTGLLAARAVPDPAVLAGLDPCDDAAVYRLDAERALVATVDFFPPLVDEPSDYGAVAAANAVSDIYAMGGSVAFALLVSGFPSSVEPEVIGTVSRAAADVVAACGGQVLGGHSIRCREPVFGLCVLGFVHPERVWKKSGAVPGQVLMVSKAIGTGVILSAGNPADVRSAVDCMRETNAAAASILAAGTVPPGAVTDVTGYGLIGHAAEIAERSGVEIHIEAGKVPLLPGARKAVRAGAGTSADTAITSHAAACMPAGLDETLAQLLHDPQTSGGLLAAVDEGEQERLQTLGFCPVGHVGRGAPGVSVSC